jgi:hypothetical protein
VMSEGALAKYVTTGPTCESGHSVHLLVKNIRYGHQRLTQAAYKEIVVPAAAVATAGAGADPATPPADQPLHCTSMRLRSSTGPFPVKDYC